MSPASLLPAGNANFAASRPGRRRWARTLRGALAAIASLTVAAALAGSGHVDRDRVASALGFGIEQVSLSGHKFTADGDLFDALDLTQARSLWSFDAEAVRARFEQLPWVKSVEISRVWPGQLTLAVTERSAFAIWEHDGRAHLIDVSGRMLGAVRPGVQLDLPRVSGAGANADAAALWSTLARTPALQSRVVRAERVGARRWTLHMNGGGRILLPPDGEATALASLTSDARVAPLLAGDGQIIDARAPGRVAVRAANAAARE